MQANRKRTATRRARQALLWLHVLSSVGWMSQALALFVLLSEHTAAASAAAHLLDTTVLVVCANTSAMTGFLLSATTVWGFFLHWWVLVKFAITVSQLFVGIVILSPSLNSAGAQPHPMLIVSTVVMASLIALQALLSVTKPWGRVPGRPAKAGSTADAVVIAAPIAVLADIGVFLLIGQPIPACSFLVLIAGLITRRTHRTRRPARIPEPSSPRAQLA